ncbi:MAG: hypothetical protein J6X45_04970 [Lachnospiraceae bacterium]|nr:hypothetical protein [Lachnospiraceae bacterium]
MDRNTYDRYHYEVYEGRHAKKWYNVRRVFVPNGPEERIVVLGLEDARLAVLGCWEYQITDTKGEVVR